MQQVETQTDRIHQVNKYRGGEGKKWKQCGVAIIQIFFYFFSYNLNFF